ncbi:MAG: polyisoprenyl-teichoic acid--peptidoglycan teichoic acid transferase [Actinomycetota bacterium]|nr:polyisoprenyl-teichoic acid--peptidoglycan teichoic acid transferase [Actinomycetota bacterium]
MGLLSADGHPYGQVIAFNSNIPVPDHLVFILVLGSDARAGEDMQRTRSDSIHLVAINPRTMQGTVLGFPRDSWVQIPGHGQNKINEALAYGGPNLAAQTVRNLTGLPVDYWVLTGFNGLPAMVDELGGVEVYVDRRMADRNSGAFFEPGWHHFNGSQALAYSRDRHDVPQGDFSRSLNQGNLILAALSKMRAEVGDEEGLGRWIGVLQRHARLQDMSMSDLRVLGALGRRMDVADIRNVVVPGRVGYAGKASVVYLGQEAVDVFNDLRPDAVLGQPRPPATTTTSTSSPSTTTTSSGSPLP